MKSISFLLTCLVWFMFHFALAGSVIDSSKQNGYWSDTATWKNGRVPHDSDYVVISNYVQLDKNVTLSYPGGGAIYVTCKGNLCGGYTIDCELISYGPVSVNVFIFEGNSLNYSTVTIADSARSGAAPCSWISSPPGTICVGCPISCSLIPLEAKFNGPSSACAGQAIAFTDESTGNPTGWLWLFPGGIPSSSTLQNPVVTYYSPGTHNITLIVTAGCDNSDTAYGTVYINPLPTACCDTSIAFGQSAQLHSYGATSYSWTPSTGLSCTNCPDPVATPVSTTTYSVTMVSDSGCSVVVPVTVDVICGKVFIADVFSPNGDGKNDFLFVRSDCIKTIDFKIYDRWGNKVFETDNQNTGWDGRYNGNPMNTGTYVYYLSATMYDGTTVTKKDNVALVR